MSVFHSVDLFQGWREHYPDWQTLRGFLESEAGGYLRVLDETEQVCIIRYDKAQSRMELPHVRWCRSVIWDKRAMRPLSVAPPKASVAECPYASCSIEEVEKGMTEGRLSVEEYADGFMVQIYQCRGDPTLHIATRSKRDASGTFYSMKTFRTLFLEAYGSDIADLAATDWEEQEQEQEPDSPVSRWWSYVVQHPEHRVVTPFPSARLHLVQYGTVSTTGKMILQEKCPSLSMDSALSDRKGDGSSQTLQEWIQQTNQERSWWFRGVVVKDRTGERWRFRSEKYMAIHSLRGGEANGYERYARIFTQNLSGTYLQYYPEDMIPFSLYGVFMTDIIHTLFRMYHTVFVRKSSSLSQIHRVYRPHLYAIHGVYLTMLRPSQKWITVQDIRVYLMRHPPARIAFLIRHHQEEYHSRVAQGV
jgi:hypothetical protein